MEAQDQQIALLNKAMETISKLGERRINKLYFASRWEIDSRSGGADYDDQPGDDGVTLYLNLFDQDGHRFKAAGDIEVWLYDLNDPARPEQIGRSYYDVDQTKELWYGRLLTYHFKVKCPWQERRPSGRKVFVRVNFLDYLTGAALQDSREFEITPPPDNSPVGSR